MTKIEISEDQEQNLLSLFKKDRTNTGMAFITIGLVGFITTISSALFTEMQPYSFPTVFFFVVGILFLHQGYEAKKRIKTKEYQAYKTECKKVGWEYVSVDNNDILSSNIKKPIKKLSFIGSKKELKTGEEIGIIQFDKVFYVFSLV